MAKAALVVSDISKTLSGLGLVKNTFIESFKDISSSTSKILNIKDLKRNTGQIPGVPKNPRLIKDNNFRKLKESIEQDPEMLELREIIAYKYNDFFVIIGGNMRFEALKSLNYETVKCKVITGDVSTEQLKRIILKDNSAYGEWDFDDLANEWEESLLAISSGKISPEKLITHTFPIAKGKEAFEVIANKEFYNKIMVVENVD